MPDRTVDRRTVVRGDVELAVFEYGNPAGAPVILIHGWPDTHHLWDKVIPLLAGRYRVFAYDTRGHGESTRLAKVADYKLTEFAADFFAVADAVSPDRPVHVIAHDWGSVATWEAVGEPGAEARIASFTSISGPSLDHIGALLRGRLSRPTPSNLADPLRQILSSWYVWFFLLPYVSETAVRYALPPIWKLFHRFVEGTAPEQVSFGPTLADDMVDGVRIYRANVVQRVIGPRARRTRVPVQLLVNRRDMAVRPAVYDESDRWVEKLERRDLPTGHWIPFSHPEVVADAATSFIERNTDVLAPTH